MKHREIQKQMSSSSVNNNVEDDENVEIVADDFFDVDLKLDDIQFSVSEQLSKDSEMQRGLAVFFENKIKESRAIFAQQSRTNPLYLLGASSVDCLAAMLSFEKTHMERAFKSLSATQQFASLLAPQDNAVVSLGKWMFSSKKAMSNAELRCRVIEAESSLLVGMLQLFQESVVMYIKAGLNLRAAWKIYEQCYNEIKDIPEDELYKRYDYHTVGGIQFGLGSINVAISSLPSKIIRLVSIFGLPHDREKGFELLTQCMKGAPRHLVNEPTSSTSSSSSSSKTSKKSKNIKNDVVAIVDDERIRGVRSPLAALVLIGYYTLIPSFAPVLTDEYVKIGDLILRDELRHHPKAALLHWLRGRSHRSSRQLHAAGQAFSEAAFGGIDFVQIVHVNYYELAFVFLFSQQWAVAQRYFEILLRDNTWSKALCCYIVAVCLNMRGLSAEAQKLYERAPTLVDRTYGGRVLAVEQFVIRRGKSRAKGAASSGVRDAVELCYLWNAFPMTPYAMLQSFLTLVERTENELIVNVELFAQKTENQIGADDDDELHSARYDTDNETETDNDHDDDDNDNDPDQINDDNNNNNELRTTNDKQQRDTAQERELLTTYKQLPVDEQHFDFSKVIVGETLDANIDAIFEAKQLDELAVLWCMRACLLKELHRDAEAEELFERLESLEKSGRVVVERFVFPYALFDWASLRYRQGKFDEALALLDRVNKFSDFNFEYRLYLRCHLLRKAIEAKTNVAEGDADHE